MADDAGRHAGHDTLVLAALLDGGVAPSERAEAEALIAGCAECAALHADLVALSSATRALPVPSRPRDFRLTAADAARLVAPLAGEPSASTPRLTKEMTATHTTAAHASHDTMLVASLADHSLAAPERDAAQALVAACGLCAALHSDLVALSAATRAMPTPTRPRDYTLTADDAARLHPTGLRRWVVAFGTSRDAFSRPLAIGLTTLGLAGLLVATVPSAAFMGGAASAPAAEDTSGATVGRPSGVTVAAPDVPSGAPAFGAEGAPPDVVGAAGTVAPAAQATEWTDRLGGAVETDRPSSAPVQGVIGGSPSKAADAGSGRTNDVSATGSGGGFSLEDVTGVPALVVVSGALLLVGLGLFLMRWAARRLGDG